MKRFWKSLAIALIALFALAPLASALSPQDDNEQEERQERWERMHRRRYPRFHFYFYRGYSYPYSYQNYNYAPTYAMGRVRIHFPYAAQVWVDDNYVGTNLHNVTLSTGAHEIELRDYDGNIIFEQNVEVVGGQVMDVYTQDY